MIYFDNAATTSVKEEVLDSFNYAVRNYSGNSSSLHKEGLKAAELEKKARMQIASFFHASEDEVIFTSGATESNNMALKGVAFRYRKRGAHIITTKTEHLSVLNTLRQLEEEFGFDVTYLDVDEYGRVTPEQVRKAIREETILVSVMAVNNENGAIQPVEEIGKMLKSYPKIRFHSDATQAIGKIDIDYSSIDLVTLSGHKIHSFKSAGILIKRKTTDLFPLITGGGHQNNLRSGTTNVPGEAALARAIRLAFTSQKENYEYVRGLNDYLRMRLREIDGIELNSDEACSPFILSFSVPKKASVVSEALSNREIYVSTKSACSSKKDSGSYVLEAMRAPKWNVFNSLRVSFSRENTLAEIDVFVETLKEVLNSIR